MKGIPLIIARILLNLASREEKDTLARWKGISKENASFADGMEALWNHPADEMPDERLPAARKRLHVRLSAYSDKQPQRRLITYVVRIAAAIVLMVSIGGLSVYIASESGLFQTNSFVEVATNAGQQSKVTLPDGSLVWLNAETHLKYNHGKKNRVVVLSGEAYFEVTHNPNRPFIVKTGNTKIQVLGTKFNVSHYPDSEITQASLLTGKINMSLPGADHAIELVPGQKLVYNAEKHTYAKSEARVQDEILWRQGILFFDNEPFDGLIKKLERYYAVQFIYNREVFDNKHYTGKIDNLSIEKVLDFISLTIPMKYEVNNKTIKLYHIKNNN
jgi:ferric-dicitrate binding protein FerR (iron transport regulator)